MVMKEKSFSVDVGFPDSVAKIAAGIKALVKNKQTVLLCVGAEKIVGDSLGPMVGGLVLKKALPNVFVYGLPESNVTAKNLLFAIKFIDAMHPDRQLVVVDAALGTREQVGTVQIVKGGLQPGSATNKNLPNVGDVGILGIVNEYFSDGASGTKVLHATKMNSVRVIAATIADGLSKALSGAV